MQERKERVSPIVTFLKHDIPAHWYRILTQLYKCGVKIGEFSDKVASSCVYTRFAPRRAFRNYYYKGEIARKSPLLYCTCGGGGGRLRFCPQLTPPGFSFSARVTLNRGGEGTPEFLFSFFVRELKGTFLRCT